MPSEKPASTKAALFGGALDSTHPAVVALKIQNGIVQDDDAAVLIAPTLALTSFHSVVKGVELIGGGELSGGVVCSVPGATYDPAQFTVHLTDGSTRGVTQVLTNGQTNICDGDLAFLILDAPVTGIDFPKLQLDTLPAVNDPVTSCAYGSIDSTCAETDLNCQSGNVILPNGGYYAADQDTFPTGFMVSTIDMCTTGDRGGPIFDSSGAVLAILAGQFQPDKTKTPTLQEPCKICEGAVSSAALLNNNIPFIAKAFSLIGSSPPRAGHPAPASVGATCTESLDCTSQLCVEVGTQKYCSQDCTTQACPSSTVCTAVSGNNVCLPQVKPEPSCEASPQRDTTSTGALIGLALLLGVGGRRRRRNGGTK